MTAEHEYTEMFERDCRGIEAGYGEEEAGPAVGVAMKPTRSGLWRKAYPTIWPCLSIPPGNVSIASGQSNTERVHWVAAPGLAAPVANL